ncbi:Uma2 family endonuclease [Streptomyces sp. JJ66]|uniref:Uma2 family endonuclease n=1 Tax=Streptomyces sp. JJ66 TaxID=2803843 RepID=UPI001C55F34D|nr:Uma2 family endonuclease [Streptomyces sp. JJ66]MBW1604399.1 Uma2 family endonuclease [Streptomyces sp. JJ66]
MGTEPEYRWPRPPQGGYTAEDLDRLPDLPPHTELIDGSLSVVSPQTAFRERVLLLLQSTLLQALPSEFDVYREMTVTLSQRSRPEPDLVVVRAEALRNLRQTTFAPEDVVLAVEVVSPDSETRDRRVKPAKYAAAGIPHFWRVENVDDRPVVYVHELDPAPRTYALTGIHHDELKLTVPFTVQIDLTAIDRRR